MITNIVSTSQILEFMRISVLPISSFILIQYYELGYMSASFADSFGFSFMYSLLSLHFFHVILGLIYILLVPYIIFAVFCN